MGNDFDFSFWTPFFSKLTWSGFSLFGSLKYHVECMLKVRFIKWTVVDGLFPGWERFPEATRIILLGRRAGGGV